MSARLDANVGMGGGGGPSSWRDDLGDEDAQDVVDTVAALQSEVARIAAGVAVTNNMMDRAANELMMRFPYKDEAAALAQLAEAEVPEDPSTVVDGGEKSGLGGGGDAGAPAGAPCPAPAAAASEGGDSGVDVMGFLDSFEAPAPSPFDETPPTVSAKAVTQLETSATELERSLEYLMLRMPAPNTISFDGAPVGLPPFA